MADGEGPGIDTQAGEVTAEKGFGEGFVAVVHAGPGTIGQSLKLADQIAGEEVVGFGCSEDLTDVGEKEQQIDFVSIVIGSSSRGGRGVTVGAGW